MLIDRNDDGALYASSAAGSHEECVWRIWKLLKVMPFVLGVKTFIQKTALVEFVEFSMETVKEFFSKFAC